MEEQKQSYNIPLPTLMVKSENNKNLYRRYEKNIINKANKIFKIDAFINYYPTQTQVNEQYSHINCGRTLLYAHYLANEAEKKLDKKIAPAPDSKIYSQNSEILLYECQNNSTQVSDCYLQPTADGHIRELSGDDVPLKHRLKVSDFEAPKVIEEEEKRLVRSLKEFESSNRRNDESPNAYDYYQMVRGILPFFDPAFERKLDKEFLSNTALQRAELLFEIRNYGLEWNANDEMLYCVKVVYNLFDSHWLYCYLKGNNEKIPVLVFFDLQNSAPHRVEKSLCAANNIWSVIKDKVHPTLCVEAVCFYKLKTCFGLKNKQLVSDYDHEWITVGNYNAMILHQAVQASAFETWSASALTQSFLSNTFDTPLTKEFKRIIELDVSKPMQRQMLIDLYKHESAYKKHSCYAGWHNQNQKQNIMQMNIHNNMQKRRIMEPAQLKKILFEIGITSIEQNIWRKVIAVAKTSVVWTKYLGLDIITALNYKGTDQPKCPNIFKAEYSSLMSWGAGMPMPRVENLERNDPAAYKFFASNFIILPREMNDNMQNMPSFLYNKRQASSHCITFDDIHAAFIKMINSNSMNSVDDKIKDAINWMITKIDMFDVDRDWRRMKSDYMKEQMRKREQNEQKNNAIDLTQTQVDYEDFSNSNHAQSSQRCATPLPLQPNSAMDIDVDSEDEPIMRAESIYDYNYNNVEEASYGNIVKKLKKYGEKLRSESHMIDENIRSLLYNLYDYLDGSGVDIDVLKKEYLKKIKKIWKKCMDKDTKSLAGFIKDAQSESRGASGTATKKWTLRSARIYLEVVIVDDSYLDANKAFPQWNHGTNRDELIENLKLESLKTETENRKRWNLMLYLFNWWQSARGFGKRNFVCCVSGKWTDKILQLNPTGNLFKVIKGWIDAEPISNAEIRSIFNQLNDAIVVHGNQNEHASQDQETNERRQRRESNKNRNNAQNISRSRSRSRENRRKK